MHTSSTRILSALACDRSGEYEPAEPVFPALVEAPAAAISPRSDRFTRWSSSR
jgi:hypothetical protein